MRNLSISKKLLGGFISVLILLTLILTINLVQLISLNRTYTDLIEDRTQKMLHVKNMVIAIKSEQVAVRVYVMLGDKTSLNGISAAHENYRSISKQLATTINTPSMIESLKQSDLIENEYFQLVEKVISLKEQDQEHEYTTLLANQGRTIIAKIEKVLADMEAYQQEQLNISAEKASKQVDDVISLVIILGIIALVLGVCIALIIGRLITRPIIEVVKAAEKIASGDLSGKAIIIKNNDETGMLASSFNTMADNLRTLIKQVDSNAEQVAASSEELSASAELTSLATEQIAVTVQDVASGVDLQVKLVSESYQTINEMSVGFQQIAENTHTVSFKASEASEKALLGNESIKTAVTQMSSINDTVNGLASVIEELNAQSNEINQIVGVISDLSAQTNLLSLNAAIEAARAGEHGRGFEVVATEVRKLSVQSTQSAQQIASLISTIQIGMHQAVHSMDAVTKEVLSGISLVNTAGDSFEYIQNAVNDVAFESVKVSSAVQQLTAGVVEITGSMKMISEVTQNAAAGTEQVIASTQEQLSSIEEISSSSSALAKMAEDLQRNVNRFKTS
ncbi:methyl-accepting chemotaxis protein [Bacillus sp. FJAT-28004]|uniref:methyl-accepting chemotaxis protein n=1 Tax=Bacillus sp. FJAT-28004 TaxID=1679165 RepID=UPI0006B69D8F|nr:methyl-accepting chemotaxis protein [Bacillus sp. FJAT-28004]